MWDKKNMNLPSLMTVFPFFLSKIAVTEGSFIDFFLKLRHNDLWWNAPNLEIDL